MAVSSSAPIRLPCYVAGEPVADRPELEVFYPYDGSLTGTVACATRADVDRAILVALQGNPALTRYARHEILGRARSLLAARADEFAHLIRRETGLCMQDTRYEVTRALDVLSFAAIEALREGGEIFACDVSANGKSRKIFSVHEPVKLVAAITPFNHPLNQIVHKIAPAIAAGAPMILKPSEKTPLTAMRFAELLYESGLPGWMLSVLIGDLQEVAEPMIRDERIRVITFTGGTDVGKRIAAIAGYKKLCLELGGNSPLIVLQDADLELATDLAVEGCYKNSGQRCTAVKRLLIHRAILDDFTRLFVTKSRNYICGDPADPSTRCGTVINEEAARLLERRVQLSVEQGAEVLLGGRREGALLEPTVIAHVPRSSEMVCKESFGPLAPILAVADIDDAIQLANSSNFGLSTGIVTNDMSAAIRAIRQIETGNVNVNQIPGYRIESSPFGGVKDSGLGVKEGVIEAVRFMSTLKTFSLPW